jgi:hypothetical protein
VRASALIPPTCGRARPVAIVALILLFTVRAPGQVYGRVHGVIQNAGGSPVAGAQAVAHNSQENTDRALVGAADGSFALAEHNTIVSSKTKITGISYSR